jgi:phage host-nuclease inhibitor protein Gam
VTLSQAVSEMRLVTEALRHWGRADRDGVTLDVRTRCTNSNDGQRQWKILTLFHSLHPLSRHVRFRVQEDEGDAAGLQQRAR